MIRPRPVISVITVCKNAAEAVAPTVASVVGQDYSPLEYVVIDGRSSDQTVAAARRAAAGRLLTIVSEEDGGIADAMNKGVSMSRGDLIMHLHAGDALLNPTVLSRVAANYEANGWTWAVGGIIRVPLAPARPRVLQQPLRYDYGYLQRVCYLPHQGTFLHREVFRRYGGFHTGFRITMDYEFWLRIGTTEQAHILEFPVTSMAEGGLSRDPLRNLREDIRARRMHVRPYTLNRHLWDARVLVGRAVDLHVVSHIPVAFRTALIQAKRKAWDKGRGRYFVTRDLHEAPAG
jgi:glycosyltransferase involved in cell wall biosynthesis